ncbi:response regulator [Wansuia hejianensis]|uniref:Stage 0 sporulation protein A homolog n=1 Tax=Wansuia hejianensis TaxID=2763667 RepID=A0A926IMC7_9FIRM|nr:response regulator transcription factor [Wansuia hejianensis]MBC8589528.1 response regulator transcription factor [Wansuia hejianensis]
MIRNSIELMIVDDHSLMRAGLRKIIEETNDIKIIYEAKNGQEAIEIVSVRAPDIILLDINMPRLNGLETLRRIKDLGIKSKIIILSSYTSKNYIIEAIKIGADAYISKNIDTSTLIDVIRDVNRGKNYLQPSLQKILNQNLNKDHSNDVAINKIELLSKREYEILYLLAIGYNNQEIGRELYISEKTVKNHITNVYKKLDVKDRVQAVIFAYVNQIIDLVELQERVEYF